MKKICLNEIKGKNYVKATWLNIRVIIWWQVESMHGGFAWMDMKNNYRWDWRDGEYILGLRVNFGLKKILKLGLMSKWN